MDLIPSFDEFWKIYPRKTAKGAARVAYFKALTKTTHLTLMCAASELADHIGREDKFTPHASTWLNQERWEDELINEPRPISNAERNRLDFLKRWNNLEQLSIEGISNDTQRSF